MGHIGGKAYCSGHGDGCGPRMLLFTDEMVPLCSDLNYILSTETNCDRAVLYCPFETTCR